MSIINSLKDKIMSGEQLSKNEALSLIDAPLDELCLAANEIRKYFCGNNFDICTIINAKSGKCSENCKFCAQSSFYSTKVETYPLLNTDEILAQAIYNDNKGVLRYSIVTSGKRLSDKEVDEICKTIKKIKENTNISVCASFGLLNEEQFKKLKDSGLSRVHNNLETSRRNFENICTTHTYEDKINSIKAARNAGLSVCSGGIMGLGETMEDRIDMVLEARNLGIRSIPVNILNPISGTPFGNNPVLTNDEVQRIVAIFRFLVPNGNIRLAGGRGLLPDKGESCFMSGANAAISGDMLTTSGTTIASDMDMLHKLSYKVVLKDE